MTKKIRLSWFLISSILGISLLPVAGFALLSLEFFEMGIDTVVETHLVRTAQEFVASGHELTVDRIVWRDVEIAVSWQDLPAEIRDQISAPEKGEVSQMASVKNLLFSPAEAVYVLHAAVNGRDFYIWKNSSYSEVELPLNKTVVVVTLMIVMSCLALLLFTRILVGKVTRPVSSLSTWAATLDSHDLALQPPDFSYPELNDLASRLRGSLLAERKTIEHEQSFLRYCSHELRTPISVVRTSTDCLKKMLEVGHKDPAREKRAVLRLDRASNTMMHLVETLLWLGRKLEEEPQKQTIDLENLVQNLVQDTQKHYPRREISCIVETQAYMVKVQAGAAEIVAGNIIRNAFQHTQRGIIHIRQSGGRLDVTNFIARGTSLEHDRGYGLGLELTRRLSQRLGWLFETQQKEGSYTASLVFSSDEFRSSVEIC